MAIEIELPDGTIAEFPDDMAPAEIETVLRKQFGGPEPEPEEVKPSLLRRADAAIANSGPGRALAEFASGVNRGAVDIAEFLTTDQINGIMQLFGSDKRVPDLGKMLPEAMQEGLGGNFMQEGIGRDAVRAAGEVVPAALGSGQILRTMASKLPAATGAESVGAGVLRQMGTATPAQDIVLGAAAGAGGALGGEVGHKVGGEQGRAAGELIGAFAAPTVVATARPATSAAVRGAITGGEKTKQKMREAITDFASFGDSPTVGASSDIRLLQGLENLSGKALGGGSFKHAFERTSQRMQARLAEIANDVSPVAGDLEAGRVISRGISGEGGFVDRFKAQSGNLWRRFDGHVPQGSDVRIDGTRSALDELVSDGRFAKMLNNPVLASLKSTVDDAGGETIKYSELSSLRSLIGRKLGSNELISDVPRAELKRLYGALSEDMKAAAAQSGPEALSAWKRANSYTRAGHERIGDFVERIAGKVDLDKVFEATAKGGEGLQAVNAIKRSLRPAEWEVVASNVIRRLGKAAPGQQNAGGDEFSVAKLLTDWNKLGRAKESLFSGSEKLNRYKKDLDAIARSAERLKSAAKEMTNQSGTAQATVNYGIIGGSAGALASGNLPAFGAILMGVAANSGAAKLMTNPGFVRWLAHVPTAKERMAHIGRLAGIAETEGLEDELGELFETLKSGEQEITKDGKANIPSKDNGTKK